MQKAYASALDDYFASSAKTGTKVDPSKDPSHKFLSKFKALAIRAGKTDTGFNAWLNVFHMAGRLGSPEANVAINRLVQGFANSPKL